MFLCLFKVGRWLPRSNCRVWNREFSISFKVETLKTRVKLISLGPMRLPIQLGPVHTVIDLRSILPDRSQIDPKPIFWKVHTKSIAV
jgi:hypothetical protein